MTVTYMQMQQNEGSKRKQQWQWKWSRRIHRNVCSAEKRHRRSIPGQRTERSVIYQCTTGAYGYPEMPVRA